MFDRNKYKREQYRKKQQQIKERGTEAISAQRELWRKKRAEYIEQNRDRYNEYMRKYQKENDSNKKYRERNPEKYKLSVKKQSKKQWEKIQNNSELKIIHNQKGREQRKKLRNEVLNRYGCICKCCSEKEIKFLTIDHKNGDGARHRKNIGRRAGSSFYVWLKRNNYPSDFQVLCFNCNSAKRNTTVCPHISSFQYSNKSKKRIKQEIIWHYSNNIGCNCCKESNIDFLTIDHIDGKRPEGKKLTGTDLYRWLKQNNYPNSFQVLCYNCNYAKYAYGLCPHQ